MLAKEVVTETDDETYPCVVRETRKLFDNKGFCSLCGRQGICHRYIIESPFMGQIAKFVPNAQKLEQAHLLEIVCCYSCNGVMKELVSRVTLSKVLTREELTRLQSLDRTPSEEE